MLDASASRSAFALSTAHSDPPGSDACSEVPVVPAAGEEAQSRHRRDANVGIAVLLQEDAQTPGHAL